MTARSRLPRMLACAAMAGAILTIPAAACAAAPVPAGRSTVLRSTAFRIVVPPHSPRVDSLTIGVRHRVFQDFEEERTVRLRRPFQIGDSKYSAILTDFEPDFVMDVAARTISSRSTEPANPAVRVIVREGGLPCDTTWAFLNMPPHFARKSLLAFKILKISFAGRPPVYADSSAVGRARP